MKKILSITLAVIMTLLVVGGSLPVSAKTVYTTCLSFLQVKANAEGAGYKWDNYNSILTLDGLNIKTDDDYGLKIMDGATVVLKGNNYIEASKAAIFIEAKVLFKGTGTLTLVGGENGFYCSSADPTDCLSIVGGTYDITSGDAGIVSAFHKVAISGSTLTVKTEGGIAIDAEVLTTGAKTVIKANGSLKGDSKLQIEASSITVETNSEALISSGAVTFSKLTLQAGDSLSSLSDIDLSAETYASQKCVKTVSTYDGSKKSAIFGNASRTADILVLAAVIVFLSAAVVLPIVIKKKKAQAAIAARDLAEDERRKAKKQK